MKIDAKVRITNSELGIDTVIAVPVDLDYVSADEEEIVEYILNSSEVYKAVGYVPATDEIEVQNLEDIYYECQYESEIAH